MKYKGVVVPGYDLVQGRAGLYLRKQSNSRRPSAALEMNARKLPIVNGASSAILRGIAHERRFLCDHTLYHRLKSRLMRGRTQPQQWWTQDWLRDLEIYPRYPLGDVVEFESSYWFEKGKLVVELEDVAPQEQVKQRGKHLRAVLLRLVVLFIDEERGRFRRLEKELPEVRAVKRLVLDVEVKPRPRLPYVILLFAHGLDNGKLVELTSATGMRIIGSGT